MIIVSVSFFVIYKDITLATRMANKGLLPMDLLGSASQVAEKWRKWKRAFEYYVKGKDLQDPGPIPETGDNAFKIALRKLASYFHVEENIPYERHVC